MASCRPGLSLGGKPFAAHRTLENSNATASRLTKSDGRAMRLKPRRRTMPAYIVARDRNPTDMPPRSKPGFPRWLRSQADCDPRFVYGDKGFLTLAGVADGEFGG